MGIRLLRHSLYLSLAVVLVAAAGSSAILASPVRWEFGGVVTGSGAGSELGGERFSGELLFDPALANPAPGGWDLPVPPSAFHLAVEDEEWGQGDSLTMYVGNDAVPVGGGPGVVDSIIVAAMGRFAGQGGRLSIELVDDGAGMLRDNDPPTVPPSVDELSTATLLFLPPICTRGCSQEDSSFWGEIDHLSVASVPETKAGALLLLGTLAVLRRRLG